MSYNNSNLTYTARDQFNPLFFSSSSCLSNIYSSPKLSLCSYMARSLSQTLTLNVSRHHHHHHRHHYLYVKSLQPLSSSLLVSIRTQSNLPSSQGGDLSDLSDASSSSDPLLRKLEDAIHRIIVRRSAPDWLPFVPGASYWVPPPRSSNYGLNHLVEKLANPLTQEESMSTNTIRGWPSSDYFIQGVSPHQIEFVEETCKSNNLSNLEDDEEG